MNNRVWWLLTGAVLLQVVCFCSGGGGADISNPLTGTVSLLQDGVVEPVAGARVVLALRGGDPGKPGDSSGEGRLENFGSGISLMSDGHFFDTVYTDEQGAFAFENIVFGQYTLLARHGDHCAIAYATRNEAVPDPVILVLDNPATVKVLVQDRADTVVLSPFTGMRIAGTELFAPADEAGTIIMHQVPEGSVECILYASEGQTVRYAALRTQSDETAELYARVETDTASWTARHSGPRYTTDHPYVVDYYLPGSGNHNASVLDSGKQFDIRVRFSDNMDVLQTSAAVQVVSDKGHIGIRKLWWAGGNVMYVAFCYATESGTCTAEDCMECGVPCELFITTTAQSVHRVSLAYQERIVIASFFPPEE